MALVRPPSKRVNKHDGGGQQHRVGETPAQHQFKQHPQRVHADAGRENRHDGEGDGVQPARFLIEAQLQVFRNAACAAAVIERHHEDADKHHGGHGAQPVEVGRHDRRI